MLHEFLSANRAAIIARTQAKVGARLAPSATDEELERGIPLFLDQIIDTLRGDNGPVAGVAEGATEHGRDLLEKGFTVAQVVHDYERVFQAVVELADETRAPIVAGEYQRLHGCIDQAIAQAVTEYTRRREQTLSEQETERLGVLAHESRNALAAAMLAFQALKAGKVGVRGSTASLLERCLRRLSALVESSVAQVRIEAGKHTPERVSLRELIEDVEVGASVEASALELSLSVGRVEGGVDLSVDRQLLGAALGNLLQNAFKFTRPHGRVSLVSSWTAERVLIDVEDECGGLPPGDPEALFRPFEQRSPNPRGLGLGLAISRRSVEADGGRLRVRDIPGRGCIFTVELPRLSAPG